MAALARELSRKLGVLQQQQAVMPRELVALLQEQHANGAILPCKLSCKLAAQQQQVVLPCKLVALPQE